jgi:hypothetical protein
MSLPPTLQQLDRLDRSSPDSHDQLNDVLCGEEYKECVPNLQGDDLAWLVDYLNKVCRRIAPPHSPLKSPKVLDDLDPSSAAFRKCLRELRSVCGTRGVLPTSYTLSPHLLNIDRDPFSSGGYGDVYRGTLDGSRICVKRVRVYARDGPGKATKARYWRRRSPCLPPLTKLTGILPRGRDVETLDTPKYFTSTRHYDHPLPAHFKLDVGWGPTRLHREES